MVAKSFQKFEICGDPYVVNGRQYVKLSNGRQVRWYTETEYYKMYPDEKKAAETVAQPTRPLKEVLGFDKGYVTICKGDTYSHLEWFKASEFRYSKFFGWYLCSTLEMPEDFPADLVPVQLTWEAVAAPGETALKNEDALKAAVENVLYDPSPSQHVGVIGERLRFELIVIKIIQMDNGYYGPQNLYVFQDNSQNTICWITSPKSFQLGEKVILNGTVKQHNIYHGDKQTLLTNCRMTN